MLSNFPDKEGIKDVLKEKYTLQQIGALLEAVTYLCALHSKAIAEEINYTSVLIKENDGDCPLCVVSDEIHVSYECEQSCSECCITRCKNDTCYSCIWYVLTDNGCAGEYKNSHKRVADLSLVIEALNEILGK